MDERAYASPWSRANPMLQSPHLAQSTYADHGSFPQFASASQASPRLPELASPYESSFFQCSTNWEGSQRQAVQGHPSIFQRANMNRDISEQMFMQSSQSPLSSSQPICSYGGSQNNVYAQQQETSLCNEKYTSYDDALPSSQPIAKRVPVFKAARAKASGIPTVPVKGKKRLVSPSQEEPLKKHSVGPLFTHSQKSAFKPVSKVNTPESASNLCLLPTPKKESCKNNDSGGQLKTQPLKPTFGKAHPCPSKKIKRETHSKLIHHETAARNDEGSDAAPSNKTGKGSEIELGSQTDIGSHLSPQPIKDESNCNDENNIDVTGTSDIENDSDLEDVLALTPIQCPVADRKMQPKKNPSTAAKNKINQPPKSKSNKKVLSESNQSINVNYSQDEKVSKKKKLPKIKGKKENVSLAAKDTEKSQCQLPKASKKKMFNTKKKTFMSDSGSKASSTTERPSKTKKKVTKSSSNSSSKHKTMKHGLYIQRDKNIYESDTDDSASDVAVSKDSSESILQSPTSHDSPKRSPDLTLSPEPSPSSIAAQENAPDREITHNKEITRKSTEEVTDSLDSSRYNKETSGDEAEETTNLSETVKERVMQLLNSMDENLWVQCNGCYKWRKLIQITDPATFPDKWYCTMMPFPGRNSCEEPEEEWQETDGQYIYYDRQFVVGSVVWAQVPGSPWWPAMVDIDPDYKRYDWFNLTWSHPTSYHVTFFGDPVTRAWVTCRNIKVFKQSDTYRKFLDDKKKDPIRDLVLRKAVQEACHAISMEIKRRRKTYTFVARFHDKIGKSPDNSHSETRKEKRSSIKSNLTQWKQQKQAKRLHSTASTITGQPSSAHMRDTSTASDYNKNVQSESPHDIINTKMRDINEKDCKSTRKKQNSDDKLNESNSSVKKVRKIKSVSSTSKDITFKMKRCDLGDRSSVKQDSDSSDNTSDRAQNDDKYYITKTSSRNYVESSPGNEKNLESNVNTIGNECAISKKQFIINEAKGATGNGSEKRGKTSYKEKEKSESSPTLKSKNSLLTSCGEYASSDENEEQFDSPTSDFVGRNLKEDGTLEGKSDIMSYDEDTDDQNDTDEKEHNQNTCDNAPVNKKYNNESSSEEYDNEISHEQLQNEGSSKTQVSNNIYTANTEEQDHGDYDQDGNEDKCEEFEDMEYDYEKNNDNENLHIGKKCISQKNHNDKEGDEQYNEEIYEEQDNGDDCESQKDYNNDSDYEQNQEETYEGHDGRDDCEIQNYEGSGDDDDEYEDDYDEQDNTGYDDNKGSMEKQKLFEEQEYKVCKDSEDENDYSGHYNHCSEEGESD